MHNTIIFFRIYTFGKGLFTDPPSADYSSKPPKTYNQNFLANFAYDLRWPIPITGENFKSKGTVKNHSSQSYCTL